MCDIGDGLLGRVSCYHGAEGARARPAGRHGPRLVLSSAGPRSAALLAALVIVKVNFQLLAPIKLV